MRRGGNGDFGYRRYIGVDDVLGGLTRAESVGSIAEVYLSRGLGSTGEPKVVTGNDAAGIVHVRGVVVPVGYDRAAEAPLFTENVLQQRVVRACPHRAYAVERAHHAVGAAFFDGHFKRSEIGLAQSLLGEPRIFVGGVLSRFAYCKVLDIAVKVVALGALDDSRAELAREHGVLAEILVVTRIVDRAVKVDAGCVPALKSRRERDAALNLAHPLQELGVP